MDNTVTTQVRRRNREPVKTKTKLNAVLERQLKEHNKCSDPQTAINVERTRSQDNALAEMIKRMYTSLRLSRQQNLTSVGEEDNIRSL